MKVNPKPESELKREWPLLPDGTYPFTVLQSEEIASKSEKNKGKLMFAVKLNVHGPDKDYHVYTYFADWFSEWLLRHFADTTGQLAAYEAGNLDGAAGAFAGRTGFVKIKTEPAGKYPAKNVVDDFVVKSEAKEAAPTPPPDDDLPPF